MPQAEALPLCHTAGLIFLFLKIYLLQRDEDTLPHAQREIFDSLADFSDDCNKPGLGLVEVRSQALEPGPPCGCGGFSRWAVSQCISRELDQNRHPHGVLAPQVAALHMVPQT